MVVGVPESTACIRIVGELHSSPKSILENGILKPGLWLVPLTSPKEDYH